MTLIVEAPPFSIDSQANESIVNAKAVGFLDVDVVPWAIESINLFYQKGFVNGRTYDSFAPMDSVTREEFVKIAVLSSEIQGGKGAVEFDDVKQGEWYFDYISAATAAGIIQGVGHANFGIGLTATREDIAVMLYRIGAYKNIQLLGSKQFNDEHQISDYAQEAVSILGGLGVIKGDENGNFNPQMNATRAETVVMLDRFLALIESSVTPFEEVENI